MTEKLNTGVEGVEKTTPKTPTKTTAKKEPAKKAAPKKEKLRVGQIDKNMEVGFRNNVNGTLVYRSDKTGTLYVLNEFGNEDYMTFEEVLGMRNTGRKFFENYWIILTEIPGREYSIEDVVEALGLDHLYAGDYSVMLDIDGFIFGNFDTFKTKFSNLSVNAQDTIVGRTKHLYYANRITNIELIRFLADYTGDKELFSL